MAYARSEQALSPAFLLDTNICIYILGDADCAAAHRVGEHEPGEVVASAISYAEVVRGVDPAALVELDKVRRFFEIIPVLPFDKEAAEAYARLPFERGSYDRLIAAQALALGLTLVTNNPRDFSAIEQLKIENWTAA